ERPAARSRRRRPIGRGQPAQAPQGRPGRPQPRRRADAGQSVERDGEKGPGRARGRAAAVDRGDEDGDGGVLTARGEDRGRARQGRVDGERGGFAGGAGRIEAYSLSPRRLRGEGGGEGLAAYERHRT